MLDEKKKVLVIGASENTERYANKAVVKLLQNNYEPIPLGVKEGSINGIKIITDQPLLKQVDTVTLYINPTIQKEYYEYVLQLKPRRIIFNPGTENAEFEKLARESGIETVEACTLVMLSIKTF